jgi:ABC-type transport system involved in cytochrome bd biosynthesis fused ATPase/permease subunit
MGYFDYLKYITKGIGVKIILMPVLTSVIVLLDLLIIKLMFNLFSETDVNLNFFIIEQESILLYLLGFITSKFIFFVINKYFLSEFISKFQYDIFMKFIGSTSNLSFIEFSKLGATTLYKMCDTGQKALVETFSLTLQGLNDFFIFLFYIIFSLLLSWKVTLFILVPVASIAVLVRFLISKFLIVWGADRIYHEGELIASFRILVEGFKKYTLMPKMLNYLNFYKSGSARRRLNYRKTFYSNLVSGFLEVIILFSILIAYWCKSDLEVTNMEFAVVFILILRALIIVNNMSGVYQGFLYNRSIIREFDAFIQNRENIDIKVNKVEQLVGNHFLLTLKNLSLLNGSIRYENIEIDLNNELVVFNGDSGVGKTILIESILGLSIFEGKICLEAPFKVTFGYISKEQNLFYNRLSDILKEVKDGELKELLNLIEKLKLNNYLNDLTSEMSSGQRVRLGLLDVLREKPNILIIDEAFSSFTLDEEKYLLTTLLESFNVRSIIIVSHRHNDFYNEYLRYSMEMSNDKIEFKKI